MRHAPERSLTPDYRLLRARDPEAVERWFLHHADALYTFVLYRVDRERDIAADVVQETFLWALEKIDRFDERRGAMFTWLTCTARNCIRAALRCRARYRSHLALWESADQELVGACRRLAESPLPEDILERKETAALVQVTLAGLPGKYRRVLLEYYYEDRPVKEIASAQEMSVSAVKSRLHRARLAFRNAFIALLESLSDPRATEGTIFCE